MKQKILMLVAVVLYAITPAWAYDVLIDGIYYNIDTESKSASVTFGEQPYSGDIVIPSVIVCNDENYVVTTINELAFSRDMVTSVILPETLISIGANAFRECNQLTTIEFPQNLQEIGFQAFQHCEKLEMVEIPASVTVIGGSAFADCDKFTAFHVAENNDYYSSYYTGVWGLYTKDLSELVAVPCGATGEFRISESVTSVGYGAFDGCGLLTKIVIPTSVTHIGSYAFANCEHLTNVIIPASIDTIDNFVFENCTNLESATFLGTTPPYVEGNLFYGCTNLSTIYVPEGTANNYASFDKYTINDESLPTQVEVDGIHYNLNTTHYTAEISGCNEDVTSLNFPECITVYGRDFSVVSVGGFAFYENKNVTNVTFSKSITSLGARCFWGCDGLQSLFIPASITYIGWVAFEACPGLTQISVAADNPVYDSRDNCCAIIETNSNSLLLGCCNTVIPLSVTSIDGGAFNASNIVEIDIPYSVTSIGSWGIANTALTEVTIPASVTNISNDAFGGCNTLTQVTMHSKTPPSYTSSNAFVGCHLLSTIYVPIGASAAYNSEPWNAFNIVEKKTIVTVDGLRYSLDFGNQTAVVAKYEEGVPYSGDIVIPASISAYGLDFAVVAVGDDAFNGCSNLTSVQIPGTVTNIGSAAFQNCDALTTFSLPESVTSIGDHICFHCDNLATVHLNDVVTEVNWNAFRACPKLTTVYLGNSIETIDFTAFHSTGLTHIDFPASLTTIKDGAFGKSQLQSVEIPASITYIGQGAFSGISTLTSITVDVENPNYAAQNGVLYSKDMETLHCVPASLEGTFVVPAFVRSIMGYSFEACTGLTSLSMSTATPPTIFEYAFWECENLTTIYVSRGATEAYQIEPLEDFNIIEMATPESGKYYLLKSRATGNRVAIENAEGQVVLQENWITPETWTLADHGRAIWKAQGEGNEVEFQNFHSLEWLKTAGPLYQAYSTVKNNQSTYTVAHQDGNFFTLFDEELATTSAYMHADITYNKVVRWDGANNIKNAWEFVEVPADVVEELLAQKERNRTLEAKKYALTRHDFFGDSETLTDHGLIRNASFISTNKQEPTEGPIEHLLDGDVNTFFHSSWSTANTDDEFHYLQVDLGEAVSDIMFRFARRMGTSHNDAPKTIRLYGTNDLTSDTWNEWLTLDLVYQTSAFGYDELIAGPGFSSPEAYRYVRMVVEETNDGRTTNDNLFFSLSEFGVWDTSRYNEFSNSLTADEQAEIRDAIADAKAELAAEAATQETIDRLNAALKLISEIEVLTDGENFTNAVEKAASRISYSRNFKNTNWQPWYVPFEMEYDAISDNFDVARLNDVHQFDDNNDGEFERWALEIERLKSGDVIQANLPYMVRAKATGETTFYVDDAILYPSESNSIDCSSTRVLYTFTGIYTPISGVDLRENGCYIMSSGKLLTPTVSTTLKPYRWYLQPEARAGYATFYAPKQILVFEKDEFGTTGIEGAVMDDESAISWPADVYDLNGRLVMKQATSLDALPKGVYMIGGVKIIK